MFEIKSTDGDVHLGGQDFDQKLYDLANQKFALQNNDVDLGANLKAKNRLKRACELAKINLSKKEHTVIKLEKLFLNEDLAISFTKDDFLEKCLLFKDFTSMFEYSNPLGKLTKKVGFSFSTIFFFSSVSFPNVLWFLYIFTKYL